MSTEILNTVENGTETFTVSFDIAKTQAITLDQLGKTNKENNYKGEPILGIYHYDLINKVLDKCENHGYKTDLWDLFAAQNRSKYGAGVTISKDLEQVYGERAIQAHTLRRVFANVRLLDFDTEENTTNLAIGFHQDGIQVGFGNNVIVCHNQCMLGASNYLATYTQNGKGERMSVMQLFEGIDNILATAEERVLADRRRIDNMKEIRLSFDDTMRMVGELTKIRVLHDTRNKDIRINGTYPLNQSQICDFTEQMLVHYNKGEEVTLWDAYNSATNLYHAPVMDIPQMLPQNMAFVEYLDTKYQF